MPSRRILLQVVEHSPAKHVGQEDVERYGGGTELTRQRQRFRAPHGNQNFEALVASQIAENTRVVRIVFHDHERTVTGLALVTIVSAPDRWRGLANGWQ